MRNRNMFFRRKETFADYCDQWMEANRGCLKMSSQVKYSFELKNHIKPFFGARRPSGITPEMVDSFTQMLLHEKSLSVKTVRNILALFHSVFIYAQKRSGQRLKKLELIYPKEQGRAIRVLDREEEERLMRFLLREMDIYQLGVYLAARTGMRIGEVCALRRCDICFQDNTISVRHTAQRLKAAEAESGKKTALVIGPPKSGSSFRTIPMMPDVAVLCARFCMEDPKTFLLTGTTRCMDPRTLQRRLKSYAEECGIEKLHFHTLRHTFATRCVEAGFDVKTLSEILGHSNIGITMNQYVHPSMDSKRENMSRLKTVSCL
ncbi:MAG: site-specific integrase [Lachnospiraceae bacterium]|jgi:integrase|nr:site-specific integrase [Lachnospiraceae bacterium]